MGRPRIVSCARAAIFTTKEAFNLVQQLRAAGVNQIQASAPRTTETGPLSAAQRQTLSEAWDQAQPR
jgi:hypothetical protein